MYHRPRGRRRLRLLTVSPRPVLGMGRLLKKRSFQVSNQTQWGELWVRISELANTSRVMLFCPPLSTACGVIMRFWEATSRLAGERER
jgi:hypothetical protein